MSYEGYGVWMCPAGHYEIMDAYSPQDTVCEYCGEKLEQRGDVDTTNFGPYTIDFEVRQVTPDVYEKCPCCDHSTQVEEGTYEFKKVKPYYAQCDMDWLKTMPNVTKEKGR